MCKTCRQKQMATLRGCLKVWTTSRPHYRSALRARSHRVQVLAGGKNRKVENSVRAISNQYKTLWPMMLDSSSITAFLCLQDETKDHVKALKTCWTRSEHFRSLDCNVCNLADLLPHRLKTMHVLSQYLRTEHDCVKECKNCTAILERENNCPASSFREKSTYVWRLPELCMAVLSHISAPPSRQDVSSSTVIAATKDQK